MLAGWKYYRKITVTNSGSTALTDYQIKIELTSSNFDFSKANSDGSDLRFSEDKVNTIPYWIESYDSSGQTATIWVKVSSIPANSSKDIYMYYGNAGATSESNIADAATNGLGDDFNRVIEKTDLDHFDKVGLYEGSNPIIPCGGTDDSDKYIREIGNILYEPEEASRKYKAFYTGYNAGSNTDEKVHYAYSEDGKNWTKSPSNPVISDRRAEDPFVVRNGDTYYLFAEDKQLDEHHVRRWHSTDCENWTDDGDITGLQIDNSHGPQSPTVWIEDGTWYMLYERFPDYEDIALATSSDGLAWTPDTSNPVMEKTDTNWVNGAIVPDSIVKKESTYHLFYHGYDGENWRSGQATSTDLVNWTDYDKSPISSDTEIVYILSLMIIYTTEDVFYYNGDDSSGIYRGYPILVLPKWTTTKEGSGNAIAELDGSGNLHLAGASGVVSSGNVVSEATITNNIIIRVRRKYTNEYYADVSIGNGVLQDADNGAQSSWWHTTQGNGYLFKQQNLSAHYIDKTPSGATRVNIVLDESNSRGAVNTFEIDEFIYDGSGNLKWILNGTQILSGTNTDYLSSNKHIGLHQGEYSNGNGGDSYYDWVFVREYTDTEPTNSVGSERAVANAIMFGMNF